MRAHSYLDSSNPGSNRRLRLARATQGSAILLSVAITTLLFILSVALTLFVSNIALQAYYNDKARVLAANSLSCYLADVQWFGVNTPVSLATAQTTVQNELNDALSLMSFPSGTVAISDSGGNNVSANISILGLTALGRSSLLPTVLNARVTASTNQARQDVLQGLVQIPMPTGFFFTPSYGSLGQTAGAPLLSNFAGFGNPSQLPCLANLFNFAVPYDEFDLSFSQYFHSCPCSGCPGSPCSFSQCGGSHQPSSSPVWETCQTSP